MILEQGPLSWSVLTGLFPKLDPQLVFAGEQ